MPETPPWWFTTIVTFLATLVGAAASILTTWITERYDREKQLAIRRAEAEHAFAAKLRTEKEQRYLHVVQNIEALYEKSKLDPAHKRDPLRTIRELWLLGDQDLVLSAKHFLVDASQPLVKQTVGKNCSVNRFANAPRFRTRK